MLGVTRLLGGHRTETDHLRYGPRQHDAWHRPVVVWTTTRSCNLACVHCYAAATNRPPSGELSTGEARAMIEDLAAFGVPVLLLSGGEPLRRPDLLDLMAHARSLGLHVTLSTNGTLISRTVAEQLRAVGLGYVGISLDGAEATHDRFRGQQGAFRAALRGIRNAKAAGLRVGLRLTLTRHTVHDLPDLFAFAEREGIDRICFYHLVPSGRGRFLLSDLLSPAEVRSAVDIIFRRAAEYVAQGAPIEILTVDNHADAAYLYLWVRRYVGEARAEEVRTALERNGGNRSGVAIAHIDNRGNVHPDQFWWQCSLGNVRARPFSAIWADTSHPMLAALRHRRPFLKGRCGRCRFLDLCNGNLRARAVGLVGDPWAPDPGCYLTDEEVGASREVASGG
jgi:radical SAM protein with 4Fe4S-binding SPASM domain